jgi:hypothetical protein
VLRLRFGSANEANAEAQNSLPDALPFRQADRQNSATPRQSSPQRMRMPPLQHHCDKYHTNRITGANYRFNMFDHFLNDF